MRVLPQMKVKPRKLKVSGLPSPRRWRRSAAKRPNSINRVFSPTGGNGGRNAEMHREQLVCRHPLLSAHQPPANAGQSLVPVGQGQRLVASELLRVARLLLGRSGSFGQAKISTPVPSAPGFS